MKEGWEYKKLGEVATFINGDRSANYPSKKDYVVDGIPFVNAGNLIQAGLDSASLNLISQNKYDSLSQGKFVEGDILFCLRGTLGKHSIVQNGLKGAIASSLVIIRTKDGFCNKYISYYLDYKQPFIERLNNGAAQPNIPAKTMKGFSIPVPPLSEQQSIVDYLDSAFAKIDAMKANAEKALNEAKALFQASLKEMLEPKEGWEEKKFGEVCWYNKNNGIHKGTRYVGMEHIEQGTGVLLGTISSDEVLSNTFAFSKGDVLYGRLRPYLKKVIVADFDGCCSTEIFPIQSKDIAASFLMYWFLTDEITNKVNATCAGCRMPRGNMNDVLKFDISYPPHSEQQSIVTTLDSLKSKVDRLQENYDKISKECDALKQAILRQVFE